MRKVIMACVAALCLNISTMAQTKTVNLRFIETSDVHGCYFPYDFINRTPKDGSLARVMKYVDSLRASYGENLILLDNGDILQGQPTCYYYNFIKTNATNIAADLVNYMGYDAEAIGNHDVETGHAVYDKWISEVRCPVLGANVIDTATNKPYLKPYTIINRDGVKVAVLGLLTPAIPNWLSDKLWSGLRFDDMIASAKQWVKYLKENEHPDVIVGLFHSGKEGGIKTDNYMEDESEVVAREVPGFDLILFGHDHTRHADMVKNIAGDSVLCLDPSCYALLVSDAQISVTLIDGKVACKTVNGDVVSVADMPVDKAFMTHFQPAIDSVNAFVNKKIGNIKRTISTRDCYFGSAPFTDIIHDLQLKTTGANISFTAPLSFDDSIKAGDIYVSDMFNLYKYENQIYALKMTGKEIRDYLEMSYDLWCNTMTSPSDHIMLLDDNTKGDQQRYGFKNLAFNFDSAAGIDYTVDVTKPNGEKVKIVKMSNGQPFNENKWYTVAMNSYRGSGGGELLTKGAGIPQNQINKRIVFQSDNDLRYYLIQEIEREKTIDPQAHGNWKFIPEAWTKPAIARDRALIFNEK